MTPTKWGPNDDHQSFRDAVVLTKRSQRHVLRSPDTIITTAITPITMLLLFVYVFGGALRVGDGKYVNYLLPGVLLITIASGIAYTAFRLFTDVSGGIFERFQSMPIARSALLWSHVLTSVVANLISLALVVLVALAVGFRSGAGVLAWLAVLAILVLFTLALTWLAVIPGLTAKSVDGVSGFSYPLIFLPLISSAFVPTAGMPGPVHWFAQHQPVTSIVNTIRNLYAEQPVGNHGWIAIAWCVGLFLVAYALALRTYRHKIANSFMPTISQLASYANVTVRAVRHYHAKGLLPEPERDHSGYRRYNAAAVVELIRIRTLAHAGVPLSRVRELLTAGDEEFAVALDEIDRRLRAEIRERQRHRVQIGQLAAGDSLVLPPEAVAYLDRMREFGFPQRVIEIERDSWILIAAQIPDQVPAFMAIKHAQIEHELIRQLYLDVGELADCGPDDLRLPLLADRVEAFLEAAAAEATGMEDEQPISDDLSLYSTPHSSSHSHARRVYSNSSKNAAGQAGPTSSAKTRAMNESPGHWPVHDGPLVSVAMARSTEAVSPCSMHVGSCFDVCLVVLAVGHDAVLFGDRYKSGEGMVRRPALTARTWQHVAEIA